MLSLLNKAHDGVCNRISRRGWLQVGGLGTLLGDLDERGLLDETLVVVMGEFGRSPKVNPWAGRDHWPRCYSVLMAGGGVRGGHIYGSSGQVGEDPTEDPVTPHDVVATIYTLLGISPDSELPDQQGRQR